MFTNVNIKRVYLVINLKKINLLIELHKIIKYQNNCKIFIYLL